MKTTLRPLKKTTIVLMGCLATAGDGAESVGMETALSSVVSLVLSWLRSGHGTLTPGSFDIGGQVQDL